MSPLQVVIGVSTFFGLAGLLAYLYYDLEVRRAERSIDSLIQGQALFNSKQIVQILSQFKDDASRLEALKALTSYGTTQASNLLQKVKANVDVQALARSAGNHKRAGAIAIFFLLLALIVVGFYKFPDSRSAAVGAAATPASDAAPASALPAPSSAIAPIEPQPPARLTRRFESGFKPSGAGGAFSGWYQFCTGDLPAGYIIEGHRLDLEGDRACGSWAECGLVSESPTRACHHFKLQGHSEGPGDGIRTSQGVITVELLRR